MFVKICGLREPEHVAAAVAAGADAIGFVLTASPRQVTPKRAAELAAEVPEDVLTVGVFAGQSVAEVRELADAAGVRAIQLHGNYPAESFAALADHPARLIRAVGADTTQPLTAGAFGEGMLLVDAPKPGSGESWDPAVLPSLPTGQWLLAGGLYPDTVAAAIAAVLPWGVDVSSGVEVSRGVKDSDAIRRFIAAATGADAR
jgi:phosphoribosylanthranilate isomerase